MTINYNESTYRGIHACRLFPCRDIGSGTQRRRNRFRRIRLARGGRGFRQRRIISTRTLLYLWSSIFLTVIQIQS